MKKIVLMLGLVLLHEKGRSFQEQDLIAWERRNQNKPNYLKSSHIY